MKRIVSVGGIKIGGGTVVMQSMLSVKISDEGAALREIRSLLACGCELIRVAITDEADVAALSRLKATTSARLIADIHFDLRLALAAIAAGADKIRINPGNIHQNALLLQVVAAAKKSHIPIRIGVNLGSLDPECLEQYGPTAEAMVESLAKYVRYFENQGFFDLVLSLKASDVETTVRANELAHARFDYPLHVGVTEAGTVTQGTIKGTLALARLLPQGIGDTVRLSLAAPPATEIAILKQILSQLRIITRPELIACPECGRKRLDVAELGSEVEEFLATLPDVDLKVAVMGCVVNGPGEARDADLALMGAGAARCALYVAGKLAGYVDKEVAVAALKELIIAEVEKRQKKKPHG